MIARFFPLIRCLILEPLATGASDRHASALRIVDAKLGASVHAEVEFRQLAVKVLLVHVLIYTNQPALENAEESFKGVGVHIAARPFELRMVNRFVLRFLRHVELVAI